MELEERRLAPVARSEEVARVDAHCLTTGCQERCAVISVICEVVKKFEGGEIGTVSSNRAESPAGGQFSRL